MKTIFTTPTIKDELLRFIKRSPFRTKLRLRRTEKDVGSYTGEKFFIINEIVRIFLKSDLFLGVL